MNLAIYTIIMILVGMMIGFNIGYWVYANAETYGFNMTEDLLKEEKLVQACITFHIEAAECEMVYGGTPGDGIITDEDAKGLELK